MDWSLFIDLFTNADRFLITIANDYGILIYIIMFMIFFLETGIVVMAFLPGDSLLFVAGAVTATGAIDPWWLTGVVTLGAILGNTSNFYIGSWLGHKIYDGSISWIDQEALNKTHQFYLLHGGKTIFLARFVPIVRTFAPFVAGMGHMSYRHFAAYNVIGALLWVLLFTYAGYFFGTLPFIQSNLKLMIVGIIFVSILPGVFEFIRHKRAAARAAK